MDAYTFIEHLNDAAQEGAIINPSASGVVCNILLQSWKVKEGQRIVNNFVFGQMGAGLSASIGAHYATGKPVIMVEGDGGFQLNIQELQTVKRLNLPIIMFVINNDGYASIRMSQQKAFGRLTGADSSSGLTLPRLSAIARAYEIPYMLIDDATLFNIKYVVKLGKLCLCEVMIDHNQQFRDRVQSHLENGVMVNDGLESICQE